MKHTPRRFGIGILFVSSLFSCSGNPSYSANGSLDASQEVSLTLCGASQSNLAIENVITAFEKIYPHCRVTYECLQNYNSSLAKRLTNNDSIDLFIADSISADASEGKPLSFAGDLYQEKALDLSKTYQGLNENSALSTGDATKLYYLPFGGEIRGMFVNKTLLASQNLSIPTNYSQLLSCCKALAGADPKTAPSPYLPLQGNPGSFGTYLMYPYICNLIANAADPDAVRAKINACEDGVEELFREPLKRLYDLTQGYYYNYGYAEDTLKNFTDGTGTTACYSFFNIRQNAETGLYEKKDNLGNVPFLPWTYSLKTMMEKTKVDFESTIDYEFVLSPVGDEGGFGYLSPSNWIALNKNSKQKAWALEFLNYLFSDEGNRLYAEYAGVVPNSDDALDFIKTTFNVPSDRVCDVGQASFDYPFYKNVISPTLVSASKSNREKYMQANSDGTYTAHPFDYYLAALKAAFATQKKALG
jgi:ABC-type glycerol-3-phosphate transport system substrate-binding protein